MATERLFGPVVADGSVTFRLWAPSAAAPSVEIEDWDPLPMSKDRDGVWTALAVCSPGAKYRFRLADGTSVPDPASHAQSGDVTGPSLVVDQRTYAWRYPDWSGRPWHETVLLEVHPGLMGGFKGIAQKLPGLAALGITAIELMPIGEFSGTRNWGYDGVLPFAPESSYGQPDDLKAMIDDAHGLGMMVFLDVVYNHFGPDGNWLPTYAPEFFRDDIATPWGSAIDFRQPQVRRFFIENALHWQLDVSFREDGARNRTDTGRTTSPSFDAARWTWPGEMDSRVRCQSS